MQILRLPVIAVQCVRVPFAGSRTAIVSQLTLASGSRRRRLGRGAQWVRPGSSHRPVIFQAHRVQVGSQT